MCPDTNPSSDHEMVGQTFLSARDEMVGQTFLSARDEVTKVEHGLLKGGRRLPHWRLAGSTYFVTFRIASGQLTPAERTLVLAHIRSGHGKFYSLVAAVVMPDHVHVLIRPDQKVDLSRITKGIKGVSARMLNQARAAKGSLWQDESWDRIVRDQSELDEKLNYMLNNAVKRGLVEDPWEYAWWFVNQEPVE